MPNLRDLSFKSALPDEDIVSRLKCLRCIWTNSCPSSIGKLAHLRKLYLWGVHTVPASVTNLLNLQTFDLSRCTALKELPRHIGKMINLRHVILAESAPMPCMPSGFKYLISLRTLAVFFVGKGVGCNLNELYELKHLEGRLAINNLENVRDARDCAEVNLKGKKRLDSLKFLWNSIDSDEGVSKEVSVDVLENLQPHSNLKILEIDGYMGSRFASWMMMKPLFPKLVEVSLTECRIVENFPPFGELLVLRDLLLKDMDAVKSIEGRGGNGSNSEWFPSLKKLRLENLSNLKSFGLKGALSSLPSVVELAIIGCPRLESMPLLPCVERLEVSCCGEKLVGSLLVLPVEKASTPSLVRLKYLKIKECRDLISLPENWSRVLISLEELVIEDCSSLVSLDDESNAPDESTSLLELKISELPELVDLPQWIRNLTQLQILRIEYCDGLIDVPEWLWELTSLRILIINSCHNLKSLPDGMQSLTALEGLGIAYCDNWMSWPNGLGSLVSLKYLQIGCTSNLPSLPEELQQLTSLRQLGMANCEAVLALPEWLLNFTSLRYLGIGFCKNLQCVPDWSPKLTALQTLDIRECDELTSRCQKGTGEDWPNIAHIPNIRLNNEWIQLA